jgi:two-component system sensor histidine kinase RegB
MAVTELEVFHDQSRSDWVRLRTLVILRWVAIAGQIVAVIVALGIYDLQIEVGLVALTIGASVVANLVSSFVYPQSRRLSEREASLMLVFDILQLGLLLYLTGGLNNPYALLILAPVTIAATMLHLRSTVALALLSMTLLTLIGQWHLPILTAEGAPLELPTLFRFGFWTALMIGVVFIAIYARQVTTEMHAMGEALLATQLALAREQKLTDLGGVVAAAAHELGTPLATIKLVSAEMMEELDDHPDLRADAALIRSQADRCRDILRSMGRAGKEDMHLRSAPLQTVVQEAAEPHMNRGKTVHLTLEPDATGDLREPAIQRRPEIIHGLRNLIQNAVDFAETSVDIELRWTDRTIYVQIEDDGPGFPPSVIGRIGDPFMRRRRRIIEDRRRLDDSGTRRPGYEGMGLGLFIAKTLLERSGARLSFANGAGEDSAGAIVIVEWPRESVIADSGRDAAGLGDNIPIRT